MQRDFRRQRQKIVQAIQGPGSKQNAGQKYLHQLLLLVLSHPICHLSLITHDTHSTHIMPKRKEVANNGAAREPPAEESSDEDTDMIDVDFEWFDPQDIDFHGLKMLTRQLFDVDQELFDLSALSNLILSQPGLGSTVKVSDGDVDAKETDPYAFLTVLNLHHHRVCPYALALQSTP